MDVWIRWAKRRATCKWCESSIDHGTPEIMTKYWRPGMWSILTRYHAQCWLDQAMNYLNNHPYCSSKLAITDDQAKTRFLLLRRWATCKHRLKKAIAGNNQRGVERLVNIMHKIVEDIDGVGGVPTGWTVEMKL